MKDSIELRPMNILDLNDVLLWRNSPKVRNNMFSSEKLSEEQHFKWFEKSLNDNNINLFILEVNGVSNGFANIEFLFENKVAEWSFHTSPSAVKGTGFILCSEVLDYYFNELNGHKINGKVIGFNEKSIALHHRLGFLLEGVFRDNFFRNNCFSDVYCFGLMDKEWKENNA